MRKFLALVGVALLTSIFANARSKQDNCEKCYRATCSTLKTCSEVMFCYKQCGITRLDADGDGIPCECDACKSMNPNPERCKRYGK